MSRKRTITRYFMITRSSIPFEDMLASSIAPQVMPTCVEVRYQFMGYFGRYGRFFGKLWKSSMYTISNPISFALRFSKLFLVLFKPNRTSKVLSTLSEIDLLLWKHLVCRPMKKIGGFVINNCCVLLDFHTGQNI